MVDVSAVLGLFGSSCQVHVPQAAEGSSRGSGSGGPRPVVSGVAGAHLDVGLQRRLDEEDEDARAFLGSGDELEASSQQAAGQQELLVGIGGESSVVGEAGGAGDLGAAVLLGGAHDTADAVLASASPLGPPERDSAAQGPSHPLGSLGLAHPRGSPAAVTGTATLRTVVDALRQEDDVRPLVRAESSNGESSD